MRSPSARFDVHWSHIAGGLGIFLVLLAVLGMMFAKQQRRDTHGRIRMAYLQNDLHHLPLWVALDKSYFKDEGLDVTVAGIFHAGPEIMAAFDAGELDAAYVGEAPVTIAAARRGTACVRVLDQVNTEGSALVLSPASSLSSDKELTLAYPSNGSVQDLLLRKAIAGLVPNAQHIHTIVLSPPEMITALKTGQIDGFVAWEPFPTRAVSMGIGRIQATSANIWPGHPCCVVVASEEFSNTRPNEMAGLVRAHKRAIAFIYDHPDEALAVAVKYTGMSEAVVRQALSHVTYTSVPSVIGEEEFVNFLNAIGYTKVADPKVFTQQLFVNQPQDADHK